MIIKKHNDFLEVVCFWNESIKNINTDLIYYIHDYKKRGKKNIKFFTLVHDLKKDIDSLIKTFSSNRRNYLNNALKNSNIEFSTINNHKLNFKDVINTFNSFAKWKGISEIDYDSVKKMNDDGSLITTLVNYKGKEVAAYVYYVDGKTARQFLKVPFLNELDNKVLSMISSFHIYSDIQYFKKNGYENYDWGGLYQENQDVTKVYGIIKYKESFGGTKIQIWKNIDILNENGQKAFDKYFKTR